MTESEDQKFCPFMSGQLVADDEQAAIANPNKVNVIQVKPVSVPCMRERCQLWSDQTGCRLVGGDITAAIGRFEHSVRAAAGNLSLDLAPLRSLEPPKDSPSPIMRLALAVENLVQEHRTRTEMMKAIAEAGADRHRRTEK